MPAQLTARDVAIFQKAALAYQPDTCDVLYQSQVDDGAGGKTTTWLTRSAGVTCRLEPLAQPAQEDDEQNRFRVVSVWVLTLPHDTVVLEKDRVKVYRGADTETYEVRGVAGPMTFEFDRRVYLAKTGV